MSWTAETYFAKAHNYWMRATNQERESHDFFLNISFFCEFLLRGAICGVNPALNAANDEESILFSANVSPNKPVKTIDIVTVLNRMARIIPKISKEEKDTVSALFFLRNQELHSDESAMSEASQKDIMPKIYAFIVKVSEFAKVDLKNLLSSTDAIQAKQTADAVSKDRKQRVRELIKIQKDRFFGLGEAEQNDRRQAHKVKFTSATMTSGHIIQAYKCLSCSGQGFLGGNPVGRSAPILKDDGVYRELRIIPDIFECKCCGLKIIGLDELMAAGINHEFVITGEMDILEHFDIDPLDHVDTDEIIREYGEEQYYQNNEY